MELTLTRQAGSQVLVTCDNQPSHTFDLLTLIPHEKGLPQPLDDPVAYGHAIYQAIFPPETLAQRALANMPERILLISTDNDLDAVPWEYAYGPDGFLVLEYHFVRGLPADQRITPQTLDTGLHIVAVPSNPLNQAIEPLNIDGEWMRLKDIIQHVLYAVTLERTRPPTIEQVRTLVANQHDRVIHFMGHGGQDKRGALLYLEQDNGDLDPVTARQFVLRVRGTVSLVTLNTCVSATPGETLFSNLASTLMRYKVPYALGMRFSITDEDARTFSRVFYNDLARGTPVEEALLQARLTLANSSRAWVVGVPVLYTSLAHPATGFAFLAGAPIIREHQPQMEVSALPRTEGAFQGRIDELKMLGTVLTGDNRPSLVTIHGAGGQGKTALAREAVERFAYAWPGGVWATSLENFQSRELFVSDLARFLGIDTQKILDPDEIERLLIVRLTHRRTLIVLDNAETLVEAVEANNEEAVRLAQFLREQLPRPPVSLLATSRSFLGWANEIGCELTGLAPLEGVRLFHQHTPQRVGEIDQSLAWELSEKVEGHPLSLRLLSSAFNATTISFPVFIKEYEARLLSAENKYMGVENRQRSLYASIETSVRYLDDDLRSLLCGLRIFHAPFLPERAKAIFYPENVLDDERSPIYKHLHTLWQRGLLVLVTAVLCDRTLQFYRLLPTMRSYVEHYLVRTENHNELLARFGEVYAQLVRFLHSELDRGDLTAFIAFQSREDLERGISCVTGMVQGYYVLYWGWVLQRLGDVRHGRKLIEQALEIGQGQDRQLEFQALTKLALVYRETGQPQQALALHEQTLLIMREVGNRTGEGATLNNIALVYGVTGHPQQALALYEQALPIMREVGDRAEEATTLSNMAAVYREMGQLQQALALYEQALPIMREVGNRAGEATTLNNMALAYRVMGQPQQALALYEQALPIMREVGNRAGEGATLGNLALVYDVMGQPQQALALYEQALLIMREVEDRLGEGETLSNMAAVYRTTRQPQRALALYEQALSITQEVGDRAGEATTLNGLAYILMDMHHYTDALTVFEQSIGLEEEVSHRAGKAAGLVGVALLLYQYLNRPQEAITKIEQAIAVLKEAGLPQDASGHTSEDLQILLYTLRSGVPLKGETDVSFTLSATQIQQIILNTIIVMTAMKEHRAGWREVIVEALQKAQRINHPQDKELFSAILDILDGGSSTLSTDHTYIKVVAAIQDGIAAGGPQVTHISDEIMQAVRDFVNAENWETTRHIVEALQALLFRPEVETLFEADIAQAKAAGEQYAVEILELHLTILRKCKANGIAATFEQLAVAQQQASLPFDAELIPRSIAAFLGGPQEKMAHVQYLTAMSTQTTDEELKALIQTIQLGLFDVNLSQLGQNLSSAYREAWEAIVDGVQTQGVDPRLFEMIVRNTLAVLGPASEKRNEWRDALSQIRGQAIEDGACALVALLDAVIGLLDAGGKPVGLGGELTGIYTNTWQAIVERLV